KEEVVQCPRAHRSISTTFPALRPVVAVCRNIRPPRAESAGSYLDGALSPASARRSPRWGLFGPPARKLRLRALRRQPCVGLFCFSTESPEPCGEGFPSLSRAIASRRSPPVT